MSRGPIITVEMRELMTRVYLQHPKWMAELIRQEVNRLSGGKGPGISATQKQLTGIRRQAKRLQYLDVDKPWSMASLNSNPMDAQSVARVVEVQRYRIKNGLPPISIRVAKWVSRLRLVLKEDLLALVLWASWYALREQVSRMAGTEFDSSLIDKGIINKMPLPMDYVLWIVSADWISEEDKKAMGQVYAHGMEEALIGEELEEKELSVQSWRVYYYYLALFRGSPVWLELSNKEKRQNVLDLQRWVYENQDEFSRPTEIINRLGLSP